MSSAPGNTQPTDVVVVGAGPVGQVLALLLARSGVRTVVVERWQEPFPLPRAVALSHESLRILRSVGFRRDDLLEPWGEDGHEFRFVSAAGATLLRTRSALDSVSGGAEMYAFSQPHLEQELVALVAAEPLVEVVRGFSVTHIDQDADGVSVTAAEHDGMEFVPNGSRRTFRAAAVAGCDGTNSTVRALLDIPLHSDDFSHRWFVVDVDPIGDEGDGSWYAVQHLDPARPTTLISGGPGRRRFEFMTMPGDDLPNLDTDEAAWRLLERWKVTPDNATLVRHALYVFESRLAARWVVGRVALAGDAAHQMPPFLGQGFNSGVRDAANLAWRLAGLVRTGSTTWLDDYTAERHTQVREILDETVRAGRLICETDPARAAARDERMAQTANELRPTRSSWPLGPGTWRLGDHGAGHLALQARVARADQEGLLDDLVGGTGPRLIFDGRAEAAPEASAGAEPLVAAWAEAGGRAVVIGGDGARALRDVDGTYAAWFDAIGPVVLVRPDHYVYGTSGPGEVDDLLTDYLGDLGITIPTHTAHQGA